MMTTMMMINWFNFNIAINDSDDKDKMLLFYKIIIDINNNDTRYM